MDGTDRRLATPHEEAIEIFGEVVRELSSNERNLKSALRRCQHACQILGWQDRKAWFQREIAGYLPPAKLPMYRRASATLEWQTKGLPRDSWGLMRSLERAARKDDGAPELTIVEIRGGIDWLLQAAKSGYVEPTPQVKQLPPQPGKQPVTLERVKVVEAATLTRMMEQIEHLVFEFASAYYSSLRYGNVLSDIWLEYRRKVDLALGSLGLATHLEVIEGGLQSDNPAQWRAAAYACRNLLNDVANHLWRDSRKTYQHLESGVDGRRQKMDVSQGKFANRLAAYLHQKGLRGTSGRFLREEVERLAVSIRSLIAFQSEAHEPVTKEDARSVALATYFLIGELVTKTDMVPVEQYDEPASAMELASEVANSR